MPFNVQLNYARKELESLSVLSDYAAQICYEMVKDVDGRYEYTGDPELVDQLIAGLKKTGYMV